MPCPDHGFGVRCGIDGPMSGEKTGGSGKSIQSHHALDFRLGELLSLQAKAQLAASRAIRPGISGIQQDQFSFQGHIPIDQFHADAPVEDDPPAFFEGRPPRGDFLLPFPIAILTRGCLEIQFSLVNRHGGNGAGREGPARAGPVQAVATKCGPSGRWHILIFCRTMEIQPLFGKVFFAERGFFPIPALLARRRFWSDGRASANPPGDFQSGWALHSGCFLPGGGGFPGEFGDGPALFF